MNALNADHKAEALSQETQVRGQERYYSARQPVRMAPVDTAYVRRHFAEAAQAVGLQDGEKVCEWGAGMGRFSRLYAQRRCELTAVELSPQLAAVCRDALGAWPHARVEVGDILEVAERFDQNYSLVAGFFMLHHLPAVQPYFEAARSLLRAGGRFVFIEPNPFNPLYAVQITVTPGMRWNEESGVYRMWPNAMRRAAEAAGFADFRVYRYGALPRLPYNVAARLGVERWPEYVMPAPLRPFQVITARLLSVASG